MVAWSFERMEPDLLLLRERSLLALLDLVRDRSRFLRLRRLSLRLALRLFFLLFLDFFLWLELRCCFLFRELLRERFFGLLDFLSLDLRDDRLRLRLVFFFFSGAGLGDESFFFSGEGEELEELLGERLLPLVGAFSGSMWLEPGLSPGATAERS